MGADSITRHPATLNDDALFRLCSESRDRASGPGGQHRNRNETRVTLTHSSGIQGVAGERRSQAQNRSKALFRLRLNLALALRCDWQTPSELWRSRLHKGRIRCNPTHRDFPSMLAEALDALEEHGWNPGLAAESLSTSTSQLVRFLKDHPAAFQRLNEERKARGAKPLR